MTGLGMRQFGDQEADIIGLVRGITKYATVINKPEQARYCLERAWHEATSGSPGPVWLDVPVDVQSAQIDPEALPRVHPAGVLPRRYRRRARALHRGRRKRLAAAQRPVLLAGTGVRLAGAVDHLRQPWSGSASP